jgi:hypothetical protein
MWHKYKKIYSVLRQMTNKSDKSLLLSFLDEENASKFADFLMNKIEKIHSSLNTNNKFDTIIKDMEQLNKFKEVDDNVINKVLMRLRTELCVQDIINTRMLKIV